MIRVRMHFLLLRRYDFFRIFFGDFLPRANLSFDSTKEKKTKTNYSFYIFIMNNDFDGRRFLFLAHDYYSQPKEICLHAINYLQGKQNFLPQAIQCIQREEYKQKQLQIFLDEHLKLLHTETKALSLVLIMVNECVCALAIK